MMDFLYLLSDIYEIVSLSAKKDKRGKENYTAFGVEKPFAADQCCEADVSEIFDR